MAGKYRFTEQAKQDLKETVLYYEGKQTGLGEKIYHRVSEKNDSVCEKLEKYSEDSSGIRRTEVRGFSHYLYYLIKAPWIVIIAVWHTARKPFSIQNRIEEK